VCVCVCVRARACVCAVKELRPFDGLFYSRWSKDSYRLGYDGMSTGKFYRRIGGACLFDFQGLYIQT
jgi:hypothetical protein